ncbi:RNA-binding protein 5 [Eucyclogobius newberryi]|uniref:RNA-binding protein 5 n=1 Tax=Eucyclogobius newberryi TaxID=166745 RepID=UPI003B59B5D6
MWDGPGPGPRRRGGPHFRDHHDDYGGRDRPMPDYRGRGGMNMGPRHFDMPPMDMRRMDGPPMRGHDRDPRGMGGPGGRDFFRRGEEPEFAPGRQVEVNFKERFAYTPGFGEEGRNPDDMDARNMPQREPGGRFMDMDREGFQFERSPFHSEGRRGFPPDRMDRKDRFREGRDRSPMRHNEGFDMDMPPHERRRMDMDRGRGRSAFNPRGGFDSDMDFRNRPGPISDFRGRGPSHSPPRFGNEPIPHDDRGGPEFAPEDSGPQTTDEAAIDPEGDSPLTDFRCGEEMTLAEEWKHRKEKKPFMVSSKGFGSTNEPNYPMDFGRNENIRDSLHFQERNKMPMDYPANDLNFPCRDNFPPMDLPGKKGSPDFMPPLNDLLSRERGKKPWLEDRDLEYRQPPPNLVKTQSPHELHKPPESFKDVSCSQAPPSTKSDEDTDLSSSSGPPPRDQDYRDVDYRTESRAFAFKPEMLPTPDTLISKSAAPERFIESASQDQDYRGAVFEDPVSNTLSIMGIPKTATMEQILGAFTTPDGVLLQGMKIKTVVPGYSYDTAIVEFLNPEDAVHIMESNKGSLKIGSNLASMKFVRPEDCSRVPQDVDHTFPHDAESHLTRPSAPPEELKSTLNGSAPGLAPDESSTDQWQRSSDLTPEAWQQQVDQLQQQEDVPREPWTSQQPPPQHLAQTDYGESKTLIIKYVKPTTTVETILKALDPYAYLDERNVRIVKAKTGNKCFCFVDMESHEQVKRLVELLSKLRPVYIDGFRVYVEIAKPLKNPAQPNSTWPPPPAKPQQPFMPPPQYMPPIPPPVTAPTEMQGKAPLTLNRLFLCAFIASYLDVLSSGGVMLVTPNLPLPLNPSMSQGLGYVDTPVHLPIEPVTAKPPQPNFYVPEAPDVTNYLYDATSGFYYDPETTLYYDPNSRYFYNAENQEYLYWDPTLKVYIPVPAGQSADGHAVGMTMMDHAILSNPAADAPLEMKKPPPNPHITHTPQVPHTPLAPQTSQITHAPPAPNVPQVPLSAPIEPTSAPTVAPEPVTALAPPAPASPPQDMKEDEEGRKDKDDKPKSRAAVKIMKDMERWAKIQNRQKDSVRTPSSHSRGDDDRRQSKSADAGFAVFERKITGGSEELFKMPFAPKKDEKSKRSMGSLGALVSDYGAGSDEEMEEDKDEPKASKNSNSSEKEDRLTDWKKMACLLCRRQFPNKDALVRHQQLSDLHKQNMEIHLKIKRSKKELEALENQEKQLNAQVGPVATKSPEVKKRKPPPSPPPLPPQLQDDWASSSREPKTQLSDRPGLGAVPAPVQKKKKKVYSHAAYKQAVRNAMFARYKELE